AALSVVAPQRLARPSAPLSSRKRSSPWPRSKRRPPFPVRGVLGQHGKRLTWANAVPVSYGVAQHGDSEPIRSFLEGEFGTAIAGPIDVRVASVVLQVEERIHAARDARVEPPVRVPTEPKLRGTRPRLCSARTVSSAQAKVRTSDEQTRSSPVATFRALSRT